MNSLIVSIAMNVLFVIIIFVFIIILLLIKKNTPVIEMYKAKKKGLPLCMFFNDDKTFEMKAMKPDSGIIQHPKNGMFIINSEGTYIDRNSKFVVVPFSSSIGISLPAKFPKLIDSLKSLLGDEIKLNALRKKLMDGSAEKQTKEIFLAYFIKKIEENENYDALEKAELIRQAKSADVAQFDVLRESINYSSVKSMLNSITPQNVNNKINMTVVRKMGTFGQDAMKYLMIMLIAGIVIVGIIAFVVYTGNNPSAEKLAALSQIGKTAAPIVVNASNVLG